MKISKIILSVITAAFILMSSTACSNGTNPSAGETSSTESSYSETSTGSESSSTTSEETSGSADEAPADDFKYEENNDLGGIVITKYIGDKTDITIPAMINGKKVVKIGEHAFSFCANITNIIIPTGVIEIVLGSFWGCSALRSIRIPNIVTKIGSTAFQYCTGLTSVTIPNSVKSIREGAFSFCKATITYKGKTYTPDNYDDLYKAINSN